MLGLTDKELRKIIRNRDPKYDGRFYFGVKTTKIYCRPVCPARPKPENILLLRSPSEAESMGFRPCLRCKPDILPGQSRPDEKYLVVTQALDHMENFCELSVEELALKLSLSTRHLSRLFKEYLGAAPRDVLNTKRLHLAKRFLCETNSSITEIAFSVGFNSIRRFNESFKKLYQMPPREYRKLYSQSEIKNDSINLEIPLRGEYDWGYVIDYLDRHLVFGTELVQDNTYKRFVKTSKDDIGSIQVSFHRQKLKLMFENLSLSEVRNLLPRLRKFFDADFNPSLLPTSFNEQKSIRVPMGFESFETAISIIIGQLISTKQAKNKLKQLVCMFGEKQKSSSSSEEVFLFPTPAKLATADIEKVGLTRAKAEAIRALSRKISDGEIKLNYLYEVEETKRKLLTIKGIGRWTTELIAMRCLGDTNAFPESDLFVKRALNERVNIEKWQGMRSYLCHLIWRSLNKGESCQDLK